jgi:glyoxylase-like metal-dependent hydrolase (beta-lactamase superfamily II)
VPYTGDVTVGGDADVRTAGALQVTKVATPPFENNCYLLRCTATGDTLLVDAAGDAPLLLSLVGDGRLVGVFETHGHWDHVQALAEVTQATGAPVLVHAGDAEMLPVMADRLLEDGEALTVGECTLSVVHLEGHTPGSLALLWEGDPERPHLWSGDSLFPGGAGNTEQDARALRPPHGRPRAQGLRAAAGPDVGLPGARQGHDAAAPSARASRWRARGW